MEEASKFIGPLLQYWLKMQFSTLSMEQDFKRKSMLNFTIYEMTSI